MARDAPGLSAEFAEKAPAAFARILGRCDTEEIRSVLSNLPASVQASIATRLPARKLQALIDTAEADVSAWLTNGPFEDAVALLSRFGRDRRLALVRGVGNEKRRRRLLRSQQYPPHSVGTLVQDLVVPIVADARAADVAAELRELGDADPGALVVTDGSGGYVGMLDSWRLLANAQPEGSIRNYLDPVTVVHPEVPIASVAAWSDWNSSNWLPVVDNERRVLGAVSRERVFAAAGSANRAQDRDILFELLDELVHVAGAVTERLLRVTDSRR